MEGGKVECAGNVYYIKGPDKDDTPQNHVPVDRWNYEEMMDLADALDGAEYSKVMNHKAKHKWTKRVT